MIIDFLSLLILLFSILLLGFLFQSLDLYLQSNRWEYLSDQRITSDLHIKLNLGFVNDLYLPQVFHPLLLCTHQQCLLTLGESWCIGWPVGEVEAQQVWLNIVVLSLNGEQFKNVCDFFFQGSQALDAIAFIASLKVNKEFVYL